MKTINLRQFGKSDPRNRNVFLHTEVKEGREAAIACGLKEAILAGTTVNLEYEDGPGWFPVGKTVLTTDVFYESWIKGFVGPVAREVGIDVFLHNIRVNGKGLEEFPWQSFASNIKKYLDSELRRIGREAKKKIRDATPAVWSDEFQFFVPEIGTVVQLSQDWEFRLISESRNSPLCDQLSVRTDYSWRSGLREFQAEIKAGAELTVDRIYIRKGAKDFSSITFCLGTGALVRLLPDGKQIVSKGKARFWAKLSDVNRMRVKVAKNTLAEN